MSASGLLAWAQANPASALGIAYLGCAAVLAQLLHITRPGADDDQGQE